MVEKKVTGLTGERETDIVNLLNRGVVDIVEADSLRRRLAAGRPLRVKHGLDPTGPNLHLGRGATLWKLRQFQELGHQIVLIIGDSTALVGDPSDKPAGDRRSLSSSEIAENERHYLEQIGRLIDLEKTEVRHNSEWLGRLNLEDIFQLAQIFTIQQMLSRENFSQRLSAKRNIGLQEVIYPLLQGYDSVMVKADIEIGGTDQLFNCLAGRKMQSHFGQWPQEVMTLTLLTGTDGRKMSTSWGNTILFTDPPAVKYRQLMRLPAYLVPVYLECTSAIALSRVREVEAAVEAGLPALPFKRELARAVVTIYDGEEAAKAAEKAVGDDKFDEIVPLAEVGETVDSSQVLRLLIEANLIRSKKEAQQLLEQKQIRLAGRVLQAGQRYDIRTMGKQVVVQVGRAKQIRLVFFPAAEV